MQNFIPLMLYPSKNTHMVVYSKPFCKYFFEINKFQVKFIREYYQFDI